MSGEKNIPLRASKAPNLPIAPVEYNQQYVDQLSNALRLYFAQIDNFTQASVISNVGVISVKDYGATGDGTTDDTAAIQAAVNATSIGGNLYFPPGTYKLTSAVTINKPITVLGNGPGSAFNSLGSYVIQTNTAANAFTLVATLANYAFSQYGIVGVNFENICIQGPSTSSYAAKGIGVDTTVNGGEFHIRENSFTNVIIKHFTAGINFTGIAYLNKFINCQFNYNTTGLLVAKGAASDVGGQTRLFGCTFDFCTTGISWIMDGTGGALTVIGCTLADGQTGISCNDETQLVVTGCSFESLTNSGAGAGIYALTPSTKINPVSGGCKYIVGNKFLFNDASIWFSNQAALAGTQPVSTYPANIDGNSSVDTTFLKLTTPTNNFAFNSNLFVLGASNSGNNNGAIGSSQISALFQGIDLRKYRYTRQYVFDATYVSGTTTLTFPIGFVPLAVRLYLTANATVFTGLKLGDSDNDSRYIPVFNGQTQALNTWINWTPPVPQFKVTTNNQTQLKLIGTTGMQGATGVIEVDGYTTI